MCTVSLATRENGYLLGMNRDEQRTRVAALPPALIEEHGVRCLFPSEPEGGTWIAANENGLAVALINWYSVPRRVKDAPLSRGVIARTAARSQALHEAAALLRRQPLFRVNPFRMIMADPRTHSIAEWRWNLDELTELRHDWFAGPDRDRFRTHQWSSSGFDEPAAQQARHGAFARHRFQSDRRAESLRDLHASHAPAQGPLSTCMHRADAVTVSYTEIDCTGSSIVMHYLPHSPCGQEPGCTTNAHRPASSATTLRLNRVVGRGRTAAALPSPEAMPFR